MELIAVINEIETKFQDKEMYISLFTTMEKAKEHFAKQVEKARDRIGEYENAEVLVDTDKCFYVDCDDDGYEIYFINDNLSVDDGNERYIDPFYGIKFNFNQKGGNNVRKLYGYCGQLPTTKAVGFLAGWNRENYRN